MDFDITKMIDVVRSGADHVDLHETQGRKTLLVHGFGQHDSKLLDVNLEAGAEKPLRKRGEVVVFDPDSFNRVIAANRDAGDATIYVDPKADDPRVVGVLNGNGTGGAGWGDLRISLAFRKTPQWEKWQKIDGKLLSQEEFAEFIEENLTDIQVPAGAEMLEIAQFLEVNRDLRFKSGLRLQSGAVEFERVETDNVSVGKSKIAVPDMIKLGLKPFMGLDSFIIDARFRWRLSGGRLTLGIKLMRVETLMEQIVADVVGKIDAGSDVPVVFGIAPGATR